MVNARSTSTTTTAPAASAEILNGIQKGWGFVPNWYMAQVTETIERTAKEAALDGKWKHPPMTKT